MVIQSKWLFFCRSSCLCRRDCCVTRNCRRTWERTGNATWRRGTTLQRSGRRTATWWKNCSNPRRSLAVVLVPHTSVRGELLRVLCCIFNPRRLLYGWNHWFKWIRIEGVFIKPLVSSHSEKILSRYVYGIVSLVQLLRLLGTLPTFQSSITSLTGVCTAEGNLFKLRFILKNNQTWSNTSRYVTTRTTRCYYYIFRQTLLHRAYHLHISYLISAMYINIRVLIIIIVIIKRIFYSILLQSFNTNPNLEH